MGFVGCVVPGFAVRVTATGQKSFVLVTRYPGSANPNARALGKVGAITFEDARTKGREWLKQIDAGIGRALSALAAERDTLGAICEELLRRDGAKLRSADRIRATLTASSTQPLAREAVHAIRRSNIVMLLDEIEDERGPVMATRTLAIIGRVMNPHASRSDDFRSPIVPGMARRNGQARDQVLSDDESRPFGGLLHRSSPCARLGSVLVLRARRNEVAKMKWAEINAETWVLPASRNKVAVELVRPLSRSALAIIESLPGWAHGFSPALAKPRCQVLPCLRSSLIEPLVLTAGPSRTSAELLAR